MGPHQPGYRVWCHVFGYLAQSLSAVFQRLHPEASAYQLAMFEAGEVRGTWDGQAGQWQFIRTGQGADEIEKTAGASTDETHVDALTNTAL